MSITRLECQVSELVNSDTCPRPTTGPTYLIVGGLVFVPLSCPMLENKKHKTRSHALYHLINFEYIERFREPGEEEPVCSIVTICANLSNCADNILVSTICLYSCRRFGVPSV